MNRSKLEVKLSYITGLREIVLDEIKTNPKLSIAAENTDSVYIKFTKETPADVMKLRSVARCYIVSSDRRYHPAYVAKHKSVLSDIIDIVMEGNKKQFKNFRITCAGSDSEEVKDIRRFIGKVYDLAERKEADLKVHIIKSNGLWEVGVEITPRPLSVREYKVANISGAMDPTIAYAVNSFCLLDKAKTYLNVFSGSATLLVEAGQCYPNLERLIGFDNNKKHLSLSIKNIKKARLIHKIQIKEADIFDKPSLGRFDIITSDLPFGMSISKGEDLRKLYKCFINYCEEALNRNGRLAVYTSKHELLKELISKSKFKIVKTLDLKLTTSVNAYLYPKIFVCEFKKYGGVGS